METNQHFSIINNQFEPQEAQSILVTLLGSVSQWYLMENFSNKIRFGDDNEQLQREAHRLEVLTHQMRMALHEAQQQGIKVTIQVDLVLMPTL